MLNSARSALGAGKSCFMHYFRLSCFSPSLKKLGSMGAVFTLLVVLSIAISGELGLCTVNNSQVADDTCIGAGCELNEEGWNCAEHFRDCL